MAEVDQTMVDLTVDLYRAYKVSKDTADAFNEATKELAERIAAEDADKAYLELMEKAEEAAYSKAKEDWSLDDQRATLEAVAEILGDDFTDQIEAARARIEAFEQQEKMYQDMLAGGSPDIEEFAKALGLSVDEYAEGQQVAPSEDASFN